jgi:RNA polymerase sigma-70 factor (ECF subfamily)
MNTLLTREQFAAAYEQYFGLTVHTMKKRYALPLHTAEEFAQQAWVRGWEKLEQWKGESALFHWINTIASNLVRAEFRDARAHQINTDLELDGFVAPNPSPEQQVEVALLHRRIEDLPVRYRAVAVELCQGAGLQEIAKCVGTSETAVRLRAFRMRLILREQMHDRNHSR